MTFTQIAFIAIISAVLTIPAVLFIPRARQSPAFDMFLWIATWVIGFLGAWAMLGYTTAPGADFALNRYRVADVPFLTILVGVAGGIIFLHLVLLGLDRLAHPAAEMDDLEDMESREIAPEPESNMPPESSPSVEEHQNGQNLPS